MGKGEKHLNKKKEEGIDIVAGLFSLLDRSPEIEKDELLALLSLMMVPFLKIYK
jgi:hypothetical protein